MMAQNPGVCTGVGKELMGAEGGRRGKMGWHEGWRRTLVSAQGARWWW